MHLRTSNRRATTQVLGWALGGLVLAALLVVMAHSVTGIGSPRYSVLIEEWLYDFVTLSAAVVVLARAVLRREERIAWTLVGLGLLGWALGDLQWTFFLRTLDEPPFPSLGDAFYLAGYGFILAGVIAYLASRAGRMSPIVWTDVAMGALCVSAIGTSVLLDFVLANTTGTAAEVAVAVSYPLLDVVILALAAAAIALTGWRPGRGLALIAGGVVCAAIGDAVYTYQSLANTYGASGWVNAFWPLSTVLIAAAALQPSPRRRETQPTEGWRAFASPGIFALAILALLMLQGQEMNEPVVAVLTWATLVAVVVRIALTFLQNRRLVTELETDSLTGLANRSKLLYDLDRLVNTDDPDPHLLAILDLDGFKSYNDAFGHPAGDALLIRLGRQLADAVGDRGRAYRMGGDEFAMLVPGAGEAARAAVEAGAAALSERGEGFQVTSSYGYAELPREAVGRNSGLQLADQRMYAEKDSRRPSAGGEVEAVLIRVINHRAPDLGDHGNAVKRLALAVGRDLGMSPGELTSLGRASELHDIGKIAIPDAILNKPGPLSDEEWEFMHQHTILGERIVAAAPSLVSVGRLIRATHERWDGKGYPDRLTGEETPLAARIIFACDAFDAITSERPYARALDTDAALAELERCADTQFDSRVVRSLEKVIRAGLAERAESQQVPSLG